MVPKLMLLVHAHVIGRTSADPQSKQSSQSKVAEQASRH